MPFCVIKTAPPGITACAILGFLTPNCPRLGVKYSCGSVFCLGELTLIFAPRSSGKNTSAIQKAFFTV